MSFILRNFIMAGLKDAVGKLPDHQLILQAAGWHHKGVLSEADLAALDVLLAEKNRVEAEGCAISF